MSCDWRENEQHKAKSTKRGVQREHLVGCSEAVIPSVMGAEE